MSSINNLDCQGNPISQENPISHENLMSQGNLVSQGNQDKLWDKVISYFRKRSLWMLHYCTGCGAMELPPVMTSRWDMERFGIGPMATPRQADILLITGYVSTRTLKRVIRTYEQMPEPKWVMAFGSCAVNGGMYWDSYNTINNVGEYIPVDITIAGCMPRPEAILDCMLKLMDMIQAGDAKAYRKYKENYAYYKANQDRLFMKREPVLDSAALRYVHEEDEGGEE